MLPQNIFASNTLPDNQKKPIKGFQFYFQGENLSGILWLQSQNQTRPINNRIPNTIQSLSPHPLMHTLVVPVTEHSFTSLSEFDFL